MVTCVFTTVVVGREDPPSGLPTAANAPCRTLHSHTEAHKGKFPNAGTRKK